MIRRHRMLTLAFAVLALGSMNLATASDHLDAPALSNPAATGDRDLNDLYAFQSPSNPNNTVFILTVNPLAGVASGTTFNPAVTYEFKIDTTDDAVAEVTYSTTFGVAIGGIQTIETRRNGVAYAAGSTESNLPTSAGGTLRAGLFDDPFFFDLNGFNDGFAFTGDDFFAGANVSAIVLEVPNSDLGGTNLGVWARTEFGGDQVDRVGRPAINTVLIASSRKDDFNEGIPSDDPANFGAEVEAAIAGAPLNNPGNAAALTGGLLPDVLTIDITQPSGFLNGRTLADDVIDVELGLLTDGALTTDLVGANDVPFLNIFPYLASANVIPEPSAIALAGFALIGIGACLRRRRQA